MTRRLIVLMVGLVVTTLIIAGLGTLLLANARARSTTETDLREQVVDVAANIGTELRTSDGTELTTQEERQRLRQLNALRRLLDLDGFAIVNFTRAGVPNAEELPPDLDPALIDVQLLRAGSVVSGNDRNLVFAAAPVDLPGDRIAIIVLSQTANAGLGPAARYFVLAAVLSALIGLLVAMVVGRRLTEPIRAASAATSSIAAGNLRTRLNEPRASDHDELAELARSVNSMADSLDRARTLEQQFLLSVSHDLRTPLTSIRGYADALIDGTINPIRSAEVIKNEAARLERLVADLLDLAKLQASTFSFQPRQFDLVQLGIASAEGFKPEAADRGLALEIQPSPTVLPIVADHDRMAQVVANLLENATKFATSRVRVATVIDGVHAVMTVSDDGPGIDPRDVPHVFERLYVARRQPQRAENSSGLGLAIVHQLVTAMGGQVWVTSAVGTGTTFAVRFPLAKAAP